MIHFDAHNSVFLKDTVFPVKSNQSNCPLTKLEHADDGGDDEEDDAAAIKPLPSIKLM